MSDQCVSGVRKSGDDLCKWLPMKGYPVDVHVTANGRAHDNNLYRVVLLDLSLESTHGDHGICHRADSGQDNADGFAQYHIDFHPCDRILNLSRMDSLMYEYISSSVW